MVNHPSRQIDPALSRELNLARRIYLAFRAGAGLRKADVDRLLREAGHALSSNRLREIGRDSDRGGKLTLEELQALISAWAHEQCDARGADGPQA